VTGNDSLQLRDRQTDRQTEFEWESNSKR
jgi:hypothetical protein